jgi:hypothetical protein
MKHQSHLIALEDVAEDASAAVVAEEEEGEEEEEEEEEDTNETFTKGQQTALANKTKEGYQGSKFAKTATEPEDTAAAAAADIRVCADLPLDDKTMYRHFAELGISLDDPSLPSELKPAANNVRSQFEELALIFEGLMEQTKFSNGDEEAVRKEFDVFKRQKRV